MSFYSKIEGLTGISTFFRKLVDCLEPPKIEWSPEEIALKNTRKILRDHLTLDELDFSKTKLDTACLPSVASLVNPADAAESLMQVVINDYIHSTEIGQHRSQERIKELINGFIPPLIQQIGDAEMESIFHKSMAMHVQMKYQRLSGVSNKTNPRLHV